MNQRGPIVLASHDIPPKRAATVLPEEDFSKGLDLPKSKEDMVKLSQAVFDRYWAATPIASMKPPFFVRLEQGAGDNNHLGICVGKYYTMRGTWNYRVVFVRRFSDKMSEQSYGGEDIDGLNLTPIPNELLTDDLREQLKEIKKLEAKLNKFNSGDEPVQ